jgi:hypothetical protein
MVGAELSSARARLYAEQLHSIVEGGGGEETASISSGGFAEVPRPVWRASF